MMKSITVFELKEKIDNNQEFQLIDVREPYEYEIVNISETLMPVGAIDGQISKIEKNIPVIIHCKSGKRSASVIAHLESKYNFTNLYNLEGGILAYCNEIDQTLTTY